MSTFATEVVKWSALGKEALIALVAGVLVVGAYGLVVIGMSRYRAARREGRGGVATASVSLAIIGGVVCLGAVAVGIIAMTHKPS
jgi:hypothetical protein